MGSFSNVADTRVRYAEVREATDALTQQLRSDARDNRDRILDAARALFSDRGLAVPMRDVARDARVGPATLYRHFPTKQALAAEAFTGEMQACRAVVDEGLADASPWRGFRRVVEGLFDLHVRNRGFTEAFLSTFPDAVDLATERRSALAAVAELMRRAQASGDLRRDAVPDDLVLALVANGGLDALPATARPAASRRLAALLIEAFRARG